MQTNGATRKNAAYPMNIGITSSSDDNDFVNPPVKRNRGPEHEVRNIPRPPTRQSAMHSYGEAVAKNAEYIPITITCCCNNGLTVYDISTVCQLDVSVLVLHVNAHQFVVTYSIPTSICFHQYVETVSI